MRLFQYLCIQSLLWLLPNNAPSNGPLEDRCNVYVHGFVAVLRKDTSNVLVPTFLPHDRVVNFRIIRTYAIVTKKFQIDTLKFKLKAKKILYCH